MLHQPFYDPDKSYEENFADGPFGEFADGKLVERVGQPSETFLGHSVYLPFGIAAGPLVNSKFVKAAFEKGFDINVYKTVRTRDYPCHPWPNVLSVGTDGDLTLDKAGQGLVAQKKYSEPLSITNSFGVPSKPVEFWQEDMAKAVKSAKVGQVVVGSFQGTKSGSGNAKEFVADYVLAARLVKETGAKILEANLSCPNEGTADLVCFDLDTVKQIAEGIKNEIGNTPLILKAAYFSDQSQLEKFVDLVGGVADGVAVINTIPAKIIDEAGQQALPGEGRDFSGVCGAGIKWAGLEMVERMKLLRLEKGLSFVIVGVGGVTVATDYAEYKAAGADAVMTATGAMWNPYLAQEIFSINN